MLSWNPSHMLIIFILYVQSQPQKPKECSMAGLKFYYLQRFCHFSFLLSWWLLKTFNIRIYIYIQIRPSDSGKLKVWLKSELYQFTPPKDVIQVLCCSKTFLFFTWSQCSLFATLPCAALKIIWLPDTVKYACMKERSSRSRGTLKPQKIVIFRKTYLIIKNKWKHIMKTMY